jgi:hypothetical protein
MQTAEVSYEVLTGNGSRWTIDSIHPAQTLAMGRAQALLASNQHEAVRVTRTAGRAPEKVVFEQESGRTAEKPITISPIDEAAWCEELIDLTGFEARRTVGRVLRKYLDEHGLTALEVLHSYWHFQDLRRAGNLFDQAIHRVASIQARKRGLDASERIDRLYRLATLLGDQTRDAGKTATYVSQLENQGLSVALKSIDEAFFEDARPFFTNVVLAEFLSKERDWNRKLARVFDQIDMDPDEAALRHLDGICAEILDGSEAIREVLGGQPDLISALRRLARVSIGRHNSAITGAPLLNRLNGIMATRNLPLTRGALLDRVARSLGGSQPLTKEDEAADAAAFPALVGDLIWYGGLSGGTDISEAVTRRARTTLKPGGDDLTPVEGIARILAMLPNAAVQIGYLLDLSRSDFGQKHQSAVLTTLLHIVKSVSSLSNLLPEGSTRTQLALAVNDLRERVGSGALGEEISLMIERKLAKILSDEPEPPAPAPALEPAAEEPAHKPAAQQRGNRRFPQQQVIFSEGDHGDEAYMILSGTVEISVRSGERVIVLAKLERGEIFGEMALIDDQPRMATATALSDTEVAVVPQEVFKKRLTWLEEEDRLISHILDALVTRLRQQPFVQ